MFVSFAVNFVFFAMHASCARWPLIGSVLRPSVTGPALVRVQVLVLVQVQVLVQVLVLVLVLVQHPVEWVGPLPCPVLTRAARPHRRAPPPPWRTLCSGSCT